MDHFADLSILDFSKSKKNEWTEAIKKYIYKCITAYIPVPYGSTLHIPPTNLLLPAAKQKSHKKASLLTKKLKNFLEKVQKKRPAGRKR